uniref:NADH dehydrogenase [ubiquinone] flavoprotein 3, mitochondrial n=1 Tax=Anolis carolinensis TaxID=28377 RepID=A0A803T554_ANOCA
MAVSLFILFGRAAPFKTLQLQAWRLRSLPSAVSLCTKPEDSKKVSKKKTKPPVETAQETFDISSYKNLQHHEYTPYTFVDYDVLLSERRLPQPSSGRSSPRH